MKFTKILVAGSNSYIATETLPHLTLGNGQIYFATRTTTPKNDQADRLGAIPIEIQDYGSPEALDSLLKALNLESGDSLLILNFIGDFGSIVSPVELDLNTFLEEFQGNVNPFLVFTKLLKFAGPRSLYINFSGAGIGGSNLDLSSPSYLAAKSVIVFLTEAFDHNLKSTGKRIAAVAPGAFPSKMQAIVANSEPGEHLSVDRINAAKKTMTDSTHSEKLIGLLNFLIDNPDRAGGRVWSANFDNFDKTVPLGEFGRLRRVIKFLDESN